MKAVIKHAWYHVTEKELKIASFMNTEWVYVLIVA